IHASTAGWAGRARSPSYTLSARGWFRAAATLPNLRLARGEDRNGIGVAQRAAVAADLDAEPVVVDRRGEQAAYLLIVAGVGERAREQVIDRVGQFVE